MDHLWFRARSYGWGWTPITIEGWIVLAAFLLGVAIDVAIYTYRLHRGADQRSAMTAFLLWLGILVAALIATCFATGERPRWHWGD